jgi:ParB/RepB/Spo0J family partition protein
MDNTSIQKISLDMIVPDPNQPRKFDYSLDELIEKSKSGDHHAKAVWNKLLELASSILEVGLQQPITVYPLDGKYILYDGHRRWMAVSFLHRQGQADGTIEAYVRAAPQTDEDTLLGQLNINLQREDFNVFELARGLQQVHNNLQENGGEVRIIREDGSIETTTLEPGESDDVIWNAIEKKMGISRSRRYQIQAVLKLSPHIQQIAEGVNLPESRLRYIIPIKDEQMQEIIIQEMVEKNLSNEVIKKRIKKLQQETIKQSTSAMPKPMQIRSAIKPLRYLAWEVKAIQNIPAIISTKDPRTVTGYKELVPELQAAIEDLKMVLAKLNFLEPE